MIGHKRIPSREGGVEIVVDELSTRMAAMGQQVEAYNRSGYHVAGREYTEDHGKSYRGIRILTIPTLKNGKLNAIVYAFFASIRALFGRYDVIHYHAEGPCIMLLLPKLFGIPCVATIHGLDWQRAKWGNFASRMLKYGEKTAAKHADEVIVLSENVQRYFRKTYGRETFFIPNGIDRPQRISAQMITEKYGVEKDGYILFLARLVPEKGAHYLIEAYERLHTDKKLVIAGGDSNAIEYVEQIREAAARDDRIIMTYFVQGQILEELYSNAYVFVLPSDVEGMALSLLEAMSYGNCCIVSDIRENTEVVEEHAFSFPKGDVNALADVLQNLLDHPEVVEEYRSGAADYVCGKYRWDDVVERTLRVYETARKKHGKSPKLL
ncbi:MAG: glycosyltransferase family 4 protein [Eubacteriales bacterium]|nr:glycosyltransferase family 4 protein [Eubacteriales bacterium]